MGDSITYGNGIHGWHNKSYPAVLGNMLGKGYTVNNYGYPGCTAMYDGNRPYAATRLYKKSLAFNADIVIIMFGTNDSKPANWKGTGAFIKDYSSLIQSYMSLESAPSVYLLAPPPAFPYRGDVKFKINADIIATEIKAAVKILSQNFDLTLIDMHNVFAGKEELFSDGIHPNAAGAALFAQTVYAALDRG